jgi:hypothetical protein
MPQIIPIGTTQADSADIVIAAGAKATISLFAAAGPSIPQGAVALIQRKASNAQYFTDSVLTNFSPATIVEAEGTYRVRREANGVGFGVDQN